MIFSVIEREQAATLNTQVTVQGSEDPIQFVNSQDLSDTGVVIENWPRRIASAVEIAHPGFRAPNKSAIAKDHPGIFGAGKERLPESREYGWNVFLARRLGAVRWQKEPNNSYCNHQQNY